jgi:Tfp pilus assembly protein PilX
MSLTDLLLAQKGILLSIGLAFLLLIAAVVLTVVSRMRRLSAQRAARRARLEKEQAARNSEIQAETVATTVVQAPVGTVSPAPTAPAQAAPAKTIGGSGTAKPESQPGQQPVPEDAASPMQDILSSVFGGDEVSERYEALLKGLEPIDISNLIALSEQIAEQLHR